MKSFLNNFINRKKTHLDFAATTPVAVEVLRAMSPYWNINFYNPSASYGAGQSVKKIIKHARIGVAKIMQTKESEVIFTQGATESINLALIGLVRHVLATQTFVPHIIVSDIEHPAVSECVEYLKTLGVEVSYIPVHTKGTIDIQSFEKLLNERTILVSVIGASNETGVIQPIQKISSIVKKFKNSHKRTFMQYPFVHSDVSQLVNTHDVSVTKLGVDMLTIDGSKIYAPKMSGILVKKQYVELQPLMYGGGQEFGLRSGTESVAHIVGVQTALSLIQKRREKDVKHFNSLKEFFIQTLSATTIPYEINGEGEITPHIFNICIKGLNSDFAVIQMDEYGVECAAMTSCAGSKGALKSEILTAMHKDDCAGSSLRFSFGRSTTTRDITKAVDALSKVCKNQKLVSN
jgi:cysteine desulfurase